MIRRHNRRKQNPTKIISCLCLVALILFAPAALAAQDGQSDKMGAADKLNTESEQLIREGTRESLEGAIDKLIAAASLYRAVVAKAREADVLNTIGMLYSNLGEQRRALDYFARSLSLHRETGDREGQAVELNNIGQVYQNLGEAQEALDSFGQALSIFKALGKREGEATTLNNMGGLYFGLGEQQKALGFLERALLLHQSLGDRGGEAIALTNLGDLQLAMNQNEKALGYYKRALPLFRAAGDRRSEASALRQLGQVYGNLRDLKTAVDYFGQSLPISRALGDRSGEAATLSLVGSTLLRIGEQREAVDTYKKVLSLYQAVGERSNEARTLFNLAFNESGIGELDSALSHIEAALAILESLRTGIGSRDLRSSYFASVQDFYEFYIDLLMRLHKAKPANGFDRRGLEASERARARSLLETLAEAGADIRQGVDPELLERERALGQSLNAVSAEQVKLLNNRHTNAEAAAIAQKLSAVTNEFQEVEARIRQTSPRYAALTQPQPLSAMEIQQQLLDKDTLLLEYSLGRERSYLWAVTPDSIKTYELPKGADIEAAARELYTLLSDARRWSQQDAKGNNSQRGLTSSSRTQAVSSPEPKASAAATRLAQMLLTPVASQLGGKRLLIVADGALQFIPFAALPLPSTAPEAVGSAPVAYRPLITEHEIVSLPSASTLAVLRSEMKDKRPARKTIAILADPVFTIDDARFSTAPNKSRQPGVTGGRIGGEQRGLALLVTEAAKNSGVINARGEQIPRLPGTRKEAERILSLVPETEQMHAFDFAANRAAVIAGSNLGDYRYVHFATHGFLDSRHPELSGLLLSMYDRQGQPEDGFLRAHEVFNLKLSAELVTLSACQTGLGKEIRGEGLVGLTRGFMYAGAPRVVVSLWSVSDEGTAELMARFYGEMLKEGKRPAAALQAAQISLLKEPKFASPFYWAAFTLQGEWR